MTPLSSDNTKHSETIHTWLWMGVGLGNRCLSTSRSTYSGIEASSNVKTGFGIPSPWMLMPT